MSGDAPEAYGKHGQTARVAPRAEVRMWAPTYLSTKPRRNWPFPCSPFLYQTLAIRIFTFDSKILLKTTFPDPEPSGKPIAPAYYYYACWHSTPKKRLVL